MAAAQTPGTLTEPELERLWDVTCTLFSKRGKDFRQLCWERSQAFGKGLGLNQSEFEHICQAGCRPELLAFLLGLVRHSARIDLVCSSMFGNKGKRASAARSFAKASAHLIELIPELDSREERDLSPSLQRIGVVVPRQVITSLDFYSRLLFWSEKLSAKMETRSFREVARYLLVGYVKNLTGRYHDGELAVLISASTDKDVQDDAAMRMWRRRHYTKLDTKFGELSQSLSALDGLFRRT